MSLFVEACGAVTPVGLGALGTSAAVRAGISRIAEAIAVPPPGEPILGAKVKAGRALRRSPANWLLNLASKALGECLSGMAPSAAPIALLVCLPERFRGHPGTAALGSAALLETLARQAGITLDRSSAVLAAGGAGLVAALSLARDALGRRTASQCVIGAVDSLLNRDVARLTGQGRIHGPGNPQGVIPGEGAAFIGVSATGHEGRFVPLATVAGFAAGAEANPADGTKFSTGEGLGRAVQGALTDAGIAEPEVGFVISNHNGERYAAWEEAIAHPRIYRTRRERLPITYPATSVGDMGSASSVLGVIVASVMLARGHAAGPAVCEFRSEDSARGGVCSARTGRRARLLVALRTPPASGVKTISPSGGSRGGWRRRRRSRRRRSTRTRTRRLPRE